MKSLEALLKKQLKTVPRWLVWGFIALSFIGFLDATYLTAKHYLGIPINCSFFTGCEEVTSSQYATILDIPVSLAGAGYYLLIFVLVIAYLDTKKERILYFISRLTPLGFIASLWFLYLQLFVIKAICLYCMISFTTSTLLFILGLILLQLEGKEIAVNKS
ncbi:MAG: vitamin K epoxide reductase family protein [Candidatus Colwellbacteria bacterium]|nr:vitamin K epoxide reductase family protein [Candidatus Colwellbacteria bacterium]